MPNHFFIPMDQYESPLPIKIEKKLTAHCKKCGELYTNNDAGILYQDENIEINGCRKCLKTFQF